jgi:hypothetical protein
MWCSRAGAHAKTVLSNYAHSLYRHRPVWHTCSINTLPATNLYKRHRFPTEIISHSVWLYFRLCLSYRDVEELMAERSISLTYEAVRYWCRKFGQAYANALRHRRPPQAADRHARRRGRRWAGPRAGQTVYFWPPTICPQRRTHLFSIANSRRLSSSHTRSHPITPSPSASQRTNFTLRCHSHQPMSLKRTATISLLSILMTSYPWTAALPYVGLSG